MCVYFHPFAISCAGFHSVMVNKYRCEVMQPLVGSSMLSFHLNSRKTRLQRGFCPFNLFVERLDCAISLSNRRTKSFSSKVVRFFIVNHKNSVKNRRFLWAYKNSNQKYVSDEGKTMQNYCISINLNEFHLYRWNPFPPIKLFLHTDHLKAIRGKRYFPM